MRKEEIEALGGGSNVFSAFYDRLKETRDYHKQFAGYHAPLSDEFLRQYRDGKPPEFSGEEASGRYLDLHAHHRQFQNAPFGSKDCEYIAYLSVVGDFEPIPREKKFTKAYEEYLSGLVGYLRGFHARVKPLVFLDTVTRKAEEEFEERWASGAIPGWEDKGLVAVKSNADVVDLDAFNSAAEMETAVGTDKIKEALASMGLKQGGTPEQRRDRLWSTRGKSPGEIDKKLFAKGAVCAGSDVADAKKKEERAKGVARAEGTVETLLEHLRQQLEATKGNVEKKATLSLAELEAEAEEDDDWVEEEAEDEEEEIYNPLKLPMGWDGKPIPYWLYKLHGLNLEFTCEICGNYSYWGRRAYERHFKEFRHQHGMRCLNIPNTKAFAEVRPSSFFVWPWAFFTLVRPVITRVTYSVSYVYINSPAIIVLTFLPSVTGPNGAIFNFMVFPTCVSLRTCLLYFFWAGGCLAFVTIPPIISSFGVARLMVGSVLLFVAI